MFTWKPNAGENYDRLFALYNYFIYNFCRHQPTRVTSPYIYEHQLPHFVGTDLQEAPTPKSKAPTLLNSEIPS